MWMKRLIAGTMPLMLATPLVHALDTPATPPGAPAQSQPTLKTTFQKGDSLNQYLNAMATRFGIVVMLQPETAKGVVTTPMELPATLDDALKTARTACESQGFILTYSTEGQKRVVRITPKDPPKPPETVVTPAPAPFRGGLGGARR